MRKNTDRISKKRPVIFARRPSPVFNTGCLSCFCLDGFSFSLFDEERSDLVSSLKVFVLNWFPLVGILYMSALKRIGKVSRFNKIQKLRGIFYLWSLIVRIPIAIGTHKSESPRRSGKPGECLNWFMPSFAWLIGGNGGANFIHNRGIYPLNSH